MTIGETTKFPGGIVGEEHIKTLPELLDIILSKRQVLLDSNQKNIEIFNELQKISVKIVSNLKILDGAIAGISEFITEDTPENDEHVIRLNELKNGRISSIEELKLANSKRNLLINNIQSNEMVLNVLNSILQSAGNSDIKTSDLTKLKTVDQTKIEISDNS